MEIFPRFILTALQPFAKLQMRLNNQFILNNNEQVIEIGRFCGIGVLACRLGYWLAPLDSLYAVWPHQAL